jgi:hypothetical protein
LRAILAALLVLLGALLTFPASLAVWEQRVLMDEDRFVAMGNDVLAEEPVQDAIASRIVDAIQAGGADPLILRVVVNGVVGQLPGSGPGDQALLRTHALLRGLLRAERLAGDGDEIVLDLSDVAAATLAAAGLSDDVPPVPVRIVLVQEQDLSSAFRVARWFDGAAVYIALLPVVAFALALLLAPNRPVVLGAIGVVVLATALLRIGVIEGPADALVTEAALLRSEARAAAEATYDVVAATAVRQELVTAGIGLVLVMAAAAWALLQRRTI